MDKRISRMTYSLEPDYQDLFRRITAKTRRSLTDELRLMLDARAEALGIEPINPVDFAVHRYHDINCDAPTQIDLDLE